MRSQDWMTPVQMVAGGGRAVYQAGEFEVVVVMTNENSRNGRKARVHVSGAAEADYSAAHAAQNKAQEELGHFPQRGEVAEVDKAFDKANRQAIKNMRETFFEALETVPELGYLMGEKDISFSRTAGCSCPCSPGFIVSGFVYGEYVSQWTGKQYTGYVDSIFVTRKAPAEAVAA